MSNLSSMHQAVQFIEENLRAPISVQDVANATGYSLYHFSRTFSRVIGHSPHDYLMRRRLSESVRDLLASDKRIIDVALEYQFNSPETYSRAFRRMFGLLPNHVKKTGTLPLGCKSEATYEYLRHINRGDYLVPELVELDAIHLVGLASLVGVGADAVAELWEHLSTHASSIPHRLKPHQAYGISFHAHSGDSQGLARLSQARQRETLPRGLSRAQPRELFFMIGVAVESLETIALALVGKTIPPLDYARFVHKGRSKDVGLTLNYVYQTWLPKSGLLLAAPLWIEVYRERHGGPDDPDSESEILIPIEDVDRAAATGRRLFKSQTHPQGEKETHEMDDQHLDQVHGTL